MDPLFWVVVLVTVLSCFFSLLSISLRLFRRVELDRAFNGETGQARLEWLEEHIDSLRLSASFCRVMANLVLALGVLRLLEDPANQWQSTAVAAIVAGLVVAVFGVAIPHAWASYAGEHVLARCLAVLRTMRIALLPATAMMRLFDLPIRRLSGVPDGPAPNGSAKQEILHAAEEGRAEGSVNAEEAEMIESVMEFAETDAGEIMTPRTEMFALPMDTPWEDACQAVFQAGHSRVPVYESDIDNIIGILYAKDLLKHVQDHTTSSLREMMRKCYFVPETKQLDELLREFKARKVHLAVVLDEYGGTAGLVTIEDVLEEIVGDITDEYDRAEPPLISRLDPAVIEVDGRVHIDEVNDAADVEIPEDEEYDTVSGFVVSELGYIPPTDEVLEAHGAKFTVLEADERRIIKLRIEQLSAKDRQVKSD